MLLLFTEFHLIIKNINSKWQKFCCIKLAWGLHLLRSQQTKTYNKSTIKVEQKHFTWIISHFEFTVITYSQCHKIFDVSHILLISLMILMCLINLNSNVHRINKYTSREKFLDHGLSFGKAQKSLGVVRTLKDI